MMDNFAERHQNSDKMNNNFFSSANIGGLMSLFLGFSVLSIVELLYYMSCRPFSEYRKNQRKHQSRNVGSKLISSDTSKTTIVSLSKNTKDNTFSSYNRMFLK